MEAIATYRESSPNLRRTMQLYSDHVSVETRIIGGSDALMHIPFRDISPHFGFVRFRFRRWLGGFLLGCVGLFFIWLFTGPFELAMTSPRVVVTGVLTIACFIWGIAYLRKYKAYRFVNHSGVPVLDIIESGPEKERCLQFVEAVRDAIARHQAHRTDEQSDEPKLRNPAY
jgi:hypothetical protein